MRRSTLVGVLALTGFGVAKDSSSRRSRSPDFELTSSTPSVVTALGTTSPPIKLSIDGRDGSVDPVTVFVEGLPRGVSLSPRLPFDITPGAHATVAFVVSRNSAVGWSTVTFHCVSRGISHELQVRLLATAVDTSYRAGSMLYLESRAGDEIIRAGLESQWGGSVVELSWNGVNAVNRHDSGREIQVALYDGGDKYDFTWRTGLFGWNPVQAGDHFSHGSPVLQEVMDPQYIYIKTQPVEWFPDNKGGGPDRAVLTDTYIEQWISTVSDHWRAFKLHYRITHFGGDQHYNALQEFPAVYVDLRLNKFVYYEGSAPWTRQPLTILPMPVPAHLPALYMPEEWGALVDEQGIGLTVYVPHQYPYGTVRSFAGTPGHAGSGTNYYSPSTFFTLGPGAIIEGDIYLIGGDYESARNVVYALRGEVRSRDPFAPIGYVDSPTTGDELTGSARLSGWAFDNVGLFRVEVSVDGAIDGIAEYGVPRPDVSRKYPHASSNVGFRYQLNTAHYPNGAHVIQVRATDVAGNVALFPPCRVTIRN
jgi:Bacterial Ig domain